MSCFLMSRHRQMKPPGLELKLSGPKHSILSQIDYSALSGQAREKAAAKNRENYPFKGDLPAWLVTNSSVHIGQIPKWLRYQAQRQKEAKRNRYQYVERGPDDGQAAGPLRRLEETANLDRQLIDPSEVQVDFDTIISSYLPAFMSLGTALGIALHTLVYNWDRDITVNMYPTIGYTGDNVTITYSDTDTVGNTVSSTGTVTSTDTNTDTTTDTITQTIIPVVIDSNGNITLGNITGGRKQSNSFKDPLLASIILGLLPEEKRRFRDKYKHIRMDKYVFFRVILTYLYKSSVG